MEVKTVEEAVQTELEPLTSSVLVMIQDGLKDFCDRYSIIDGYSIEFQMFSLLFSGRMFGFSAFLSWNDVHDKYTHPARSLSAASVLLCFVDGAATKHSC